MPIYIILGKLTQKAIEQMKGFAERNAKGEEIIRAAGGKMLTHCYTRIIRLCNRRRPPIRGSNGKAPLKAGQWSKIITESLTGMPLEIVYRTAAEI